MLYKLVVHNLSMVGVDLVAAVNLLSFIFFTQIILNAKNSHQTKLN